MHIAEVVTIAKSLPLLRLNTYKSLILSYSADYRRIFGKNNIVYYRPVYNDTIYSIHENGSIRVEFAVNFGDRTVPEKYRNGKEI